MKAKKTIYILLMMLLWLLVAVIIYGLIEITFINAMLSQDLDLDLYYLFGMRYYLPPFVQLGLLSLGLVGGYFMGQTWWRIVYIEHRYWKKGK